MITQKIFNARRWLAAMKIEILGVEGCSNCTALVQETINIRPETAGLYPIVSFTGRLTGSVMSLSRWG